MLVLICSDSEHHHLLQVYILTVIIIILVFELVVEEHPPPKKVVCKCCEGAKEERRGGKRQDAGRDEGVEGKERFMKEIAGGRGCLKSVLKINDCPDWYCSHDNDTHCETRCSSVQAIHCDALCVPAIISSQLRLKD